MNRALIIIVIVILVLMMLCCCVLTGAFVFLGAAGFLINDGTFPGTDLLGENVPFPINEFQPPSEDALAMIETLSEVEIPENDYADLSFRLEGIVDVPETVPAKDYQVGDTEKFWLSNNTTQENFQITAELMMESPHALFWVEEGVSVQGSEVRELLDVFNNQIYPTNRTFFGSEWNPGIDEDERIYLIYARGLGGNVAGYFSAIDSYPSVLQEFSNMHETFMINADAVNLSEGYLYSVLAHEFQHMIHWYQDRNETSWMNEGFSELAVSLNGYMVGGWHTVYLTDRDVQLNTWPVEPSQQGVHYGSSYLFMQYFLDRFGPTVTQALVKEDLDGLASIDAVMESLQIPSAHGQSTMTAEEIFIDWTIASTINDPTVAEGQYAFADATIIGSAESLFKTTLGCEGPEWREMDVRQFGVEELELACDAPAILRFQALGEVGLLPTKPYQGERAFWSNRNDESNTVLTKEFDLRAVSGDITMDYWVWYDIEENWDYAYVVASTDGVRWDILQTQYGTTSNPHGSNYGLGYTGSSNGWLADAVDLSPYAGQVVQVRFEYVTDPNLNAGGLLVDNIAVEALDYFTGFEQDDGGWVAEGFVRVNDSLAQLMAVSIIRQSNQTTLVDTSVFYGGETLTFSLADLTEWDTVVVLVSGLTRYTNEPANFRLMLVPEE